jgi:CRP-like cAMP-binding protein
MLTALLDFMNRIRPISAPLKTVLEQKLEIITLPKKTILLKEGQTCNHIHVVLSGLLRMYYIKDGVEVCSRFIDESLMTISVKSFYARTPGYEYIETIEPSVVARIHRDDLEMIYNSFDEFNYIARIITEQYFVKSEERLYLLRKQSAEERYRYFLDKYPHLIQRVPLMYIASYLGLTLETLSRIRKKIAAPNEKKDH